MLCRKFSANKLETHFVLLWQAHVGAGDHIEMTTILVIIEEVITEDEAEPEDLPTRNGEHLNTASLHPEGRATVLSTPSSRISLPGLD